MSTKPSDIERKLFNVYLRSIPEFLRHSKNHEVDIISKAKAGNRKAINMVIYQHLRFVIKTALIYVNHGVPLMDLIGAGNHGLLKALEKFDTSKDVKFTSYSVWWVKQKIIAEIANSHPTFRAPANFAGNVKHLTKIQDKLEQTKKGKATVQEISEKTSMLEDTVHRTLQARQKASTSIYETMNSDINKNTRLIDILVNKCKTPEQLLIVKQAEKTVCDKMNVLNNRERLIIRAYYGIDGTKKTTFRQLGKRFGISHEAIRLIKIKAIEKLKHPNVARDLKEALHDAEEILF